MDRQTQVETIRTLLKQLEQLEGPNPRTDIIKDAPVVETDIRTFADLANKEGLQVNCRVTCDGDLSLVIADADEGKGKVGRWLKNTGKKLGREVKKVLKDQVVPSLVRAAAVAKEVSDTDGADSLEVPINL